MKCSGCSGDVVLAQSFDIDGKLYAISREEAFTLGVEWGIVWQQAAQAAPFSAMIHAANQDRVGAMLAARSRAFTLKPAGADWVSLSVAGLD